MKESIKIILSLIIAALAVAPLAAQEEANSIQEGFLGVNQEDSPLQVFFEAEAGTGKVFYHTLRSGPEGTATNFNFVTQGGQELLFPYQRYTGGAVLGGQHRFSLLYQPLSLVTKVKFQEDVTMDGTTFESGTAMQISYSFPFYRFTYGYDFFEENNLDLGAGAALQLRNASIIFEEIGAAAAADNNDLTVGQNLGLVPALHFFGRYSWEQGPYLSFDVTGLYASSAFINGADFDFEGSILDASLQGGWALRYGMEAFVNLRFFGGTSKGVSEYPNIHWTDSLEDDGSNYLAAGSLTLGLRIR